MKPHIFIATPMFGGLCSGHYTQSLLQTVCVLKEHDIDMSLCTVFNESCIQRARNTLAHQFLKREDATHLLFIDADICWNPVDITHMLAANRDVICGIYPKKEINWPIIEAAVRRGIAADQLKYYASAGVIHTMDSRESSVPVSEPAEISHAGTGFMLISRAVLQGLAQSVDWYFNDVNDTSAIMQNNEVIHEFFPIHIEPTTRRLLTEDFAFCKLARAAGFKIWAAPWVRLGHAGTYMFEGGLIPVK